MTEHTTWIIGKPKKFHNQNYIPVQEPLMGDLMTDVCWVVSGEDAANRIVTACNNYEKLADAVDELLEVANLRGDNQLPAPEDDPGLWTARMQTAWDELEVIR